jgi:hypothetical protein
MRFMPCTAIPASCFPTLVDPVKVMPRIVDEWISFVEITAGSPKTMLKTCGGNPASSSISPIASAVAGVCSDGLMMTEQPAAAAPLILRDGVIAGAFQGENAAIGPTGSLIAI